MIESDSTLKEKVKTLLEESLFCINNDEVFLHPAVIGDCVKSLIGTDLENPYIDLLDWLGGEVEKSDKKEASKPSKPIEAQTTSYKQLQEALVLKDKLLIEDILTRLSLLTDGTQLIEVLIQMSLQQTGKSFTSIWRIYKILNFIEVKDRLHSYKAMCDFILKDDFREDSFIKDEISHEEVFHISDDYFNIVIFSHILDCKNHSFIRKDELLLALNNMMSYIGTNKGKNTLEIHEKSMQKDRGIVLNKIRSDSLTLSRKNILILDCIRMLIKNSPTINDKIIDFMYKQLKSS